jgi:DNA-binding transcriptional MerR regulator
MKETARIGEVARAAGLSVQTLRYYERLGLLPPPRRSGNGYRLYPADTLKRLRLIRQAQALGFRLDEIKEILRMKYAGESPCGCVREMLARKLAEVERQIADLGRFRRELHRTLRRSRALPRLSHRASLICPIIESVPRGRRRRAEKNLGG